jgi:hypothetical protein
MHHLRRLMESRPYFSRVPDDTLIVSENGTGGQHLSATRNDNSVYSLVYFPDAVRTAEIDLSKVSGDAMRAWWYDPHTGQAYAIDTIVTKGRQRFTTPLEWHDWVLVLDDAAAAFAAPGILR